MKALVIAGATPLQQVLAQWFEMRGRAFRVISPDQVLELRREDVQGAVVVEAATLDALQAGNALSISGEGRHHLVELAEQYDVPFLFLSDGRVFDGDYAPINHREADTARPGSIAGARLQAVEQLLERHVPRHLVLRTGPVFSELGENFFTRLFASLVQGGEIALNAGLKACPTHAVDLVRVVSAVIDQMACGAENWGTYHYNSSGQASAYEFTEMMLAFASQQLDLDQNNTSLVMRESGMGFDPAIPVLRCEKILHDFGIKQLPWRSYLPQPIKQMCEARS